MEKTLFLSYVTMQKIFLPKYSFKFGNFICYAPPPPPEDLLTERKEEIGKTMFKYSVLQVTRTEQ